MKDLANMKKWLSLNLTKKRFLHSIEVMEMAVVLALKCGCDESVIKKARIAGLLHDCARELSVSEMISEMTKLQLKPDNPDFLQPELLHAPAGAALAAKLFDIKDPEIINAIHYHTTGHEDMTLLEKIVLLADYIEPQRDYPGVEEIRNIIEKVPQDPLTSAVDASLNSSQNKSKNESLYESNNESQNESKNVSHNELLNESLNESFISALDIAIVRVFTMTIEYLIINGSPIHPNTNKALKSILKQFEIKDKSY